MSLNRHPKMDLSLIRKIGFIIQKENGKVDVSICSKPLTRHEVIEFIEKSKVIFELRAAFIAFSALELNHLEMATLPSQPDARDAQSIYKEGLEVIPIATQRISNLLAAASSYLTITEQKINSIYGKGSVESKSWNKVRNDLHANNFGYRFAYELRNYSQHHGLPFSSVNLNQENLLSTSPKKEIKVMMTTDSILNSKYNGEVSSKR